MAFGSDLRDTRIVKIELHFIQAAGEVFFRDIAELEARQLRHRVTQRTQIELALQAVARRRRAVEIMTFDTKIDGIRRCQRRFLHIEVERHPLRHKVFHMEEPVAVLVVAGIGADHPLAGGGLSIQFPGQLIEAIIRLHHLRARHLAIRAHHFEFHRLRRQRLAVAVAQKAINNHRLAWAVKIARAEHKELFAVATIAVNIKLGQIQRRQVEIEHRGLLAHTGQHQRRLFRVIQTHVSGAVTGRLRQRLPFVIQQTHFDAALRRAVLQALGEDIHAVVVAVQRKTDVA
ncbi:hypothetical protein BN130_1796 [Cronobacter malonaticus 507]|nr:hypothetical protein BN130_1796 [Cronobacter malonaticus 507]